jgi:hypothetical protein
MNGPKYGAQTLARVLNGSPRASGPRAADGSFPVEIEARGRLVRLRIVDAGNGRPVEIRRVLANQPDGWPRDLVVVARELSPNAIAMLEEAEANWADETGRAHIVGPDVIVMRDTAISSPRRRAFSWSVSAFSIAEALLSRSWPHGVSTGLLAKLAGWSAAQVTEVLQSFDDQAWTRKAGPQRGPGSRRELINADGLLDQWAPELTSSERETRLAHRTSADMLSFLRSELSEVLNDHVRWAVSGWAAGELLAPLATAIPTLQIYVAVDDFYGPLTDAIASAGLREVDEGGRVEFWAASDRVLSLAELRDEIAVVSAPRAYGDLLRIGGRAEDAADHIRDEVLTPLHRPFSVKRTSSVLGQWENSSRHRLAELVVASGQPDPYRHGSWSASYRLNAAAYEPSLRDFVHLVADAVGSETGWPMWAAQMTREETRPRIVDDVIEAWISSSFFDDPSHADFWRASPQGLLFLLRGYEEDGAIAGVEPGTTVDVILPIWRVGEAMLHAQRLAGRLNAERIEFMMRWTGLRGRRLASVASPQRVLVEGGRSSTEEVRSCIDVRPDAIEGRLPELVRALIDPLYDVFDFYRPPHGIYEAELHNLRTLRRPA